jgi:thioesterase domain-containing protein
MSPLVPESLGLHGLESFLHRQIPLTRALGLQVVESSARRLVLAAPLEPNRNHLGTAFGGSLHALPTLACYATLWTLLREAGIEGHVVIKRSQVQYRQPVAADFRAVCTRPDAERVAEFMADLRRHGKARMELDAVVEGTGGRPAVEFTGSFVAVFSADGKK